jgi:RTX calcium-binding nonapeptide repeat (4 copies)
MGQRHDIALNVIRMFLDGPPITGDWQYAAKYFIPALFNDSLAALAVQNMPAGAYNPASKMMMAIAYSAIDQGTLVFGDAGIRVLQNDVTDLGKALHLPNASQTITTSAQSIAEILVQFAGQLAFGKVLQTNTTAVNGVLSLSPGNTVLTVDFNDALWSIGRSGPPTTILGRDTLVDKSLGVVGANGVSDLRSGMDWLWGNSNSAVIDRMDFATTNTPLTYTIANRAVPAPTKVAMFVGGGGNDTITGSADHDFIYGGGGNDVLKGEGGDDLLAQVLARTSSQAETALTR